MIHFKEYVGEPATYEHLAEECVELAKAALKYARYLRGENPMAKNTNECVLKYNVKEEATDVFILIEELGIDIPDDSIYVKKQKRMCDRLIDSGKTRSSYIVVASGEMKNGSVDSFDISKE